MSLGRCGALVRAREDRVGARVALADPLGAERGASGRRRSGFWDLESPVSLAVLARSPGPAEARGRGAKRLQACLNAQRENHGPAARPTARGPEWAGRRA